MILFTAKDCGPCRQYIPRAAALCRKHGVQSLTVDCQVYTGLASKYRVSTTPCTVILRDGAIVYHSGGPLGDETLTRWIRESQRDETLTRWIRESQR